MRPSQDREVDPIESQRLQARMDASAQDVARQQRRYDLLARKYPPFLVPSGRIAIQAVSRSKISDATPTSRISSVLVGLMSPLYHDLSTRIAPCWKRSPFFNP